ncbi:TPA: hypothetical protein ACVNTL_002192 [Legionella pneumophila]|nr:hypothetical protein [Legionella pneumophila]HAU0381376.1 hypothetical protein [Legionella pneumophila]HAU0422423.1 hypothetical protein [Legionella pneumophila]HAU0424793.1 hypothetical protein [Legionella pneumophila]HAU0431634.1 hypothetical protein [Legionella pneumophila]
MIATNQTKVPPELNTRLNSLIYLHGRNTSTPIPRDFKPCFTMRNAAYNVRPPISKKNDMPGKEYFKHLAVNAVYSSLNDSMKTASNDYINSQLTLLETIK